MGYKLECIGCGEPLTAESKYKGVVAFCSYECYEEHIERYAEEYEQEQDFCKYVRGKGPYDEDF